MRIGLLPGLLITLLLSGLVTTALLQLLVGDLRQVDRLGRWLREHQAGERALELVRGELQRAESVRVNTEISGGCGTSGRTPRLQLSGRDRSGALRTVTYAAGPAPSTIWRGEVLMRCGPAYGLDGEWSAGEAVSRVLIDALPGASGFTVSGSAPGLLSLELSRELHGGQIISQRHTALAAAAVQDAGEHQAR
ncbi:MAG: prepilin-type cleavage/methylation domain-containing protein [Prochlorococcaceae cyanobacterium]